MVIEIASLAIKSGNGLVMRGGSDCIKTNLALFSLVSEAMKESGLPEKSMYFLDFTDRKAVEIILSMDKYIDLLIPRGSSSLVLFFFLPKISLSVNNKKDSLSPVNLNPSPAFLEMIFILSSEKIFMSSKIFVLSRLLNL